MPPKTEVQVAGLTVMVVRKRIKNLHLRVYPPDGQVRISVPLRLKEEAIRQAVAGKLDWIRKQQARIAADPGAFPQKLVSGETHFYLGRPYRLEVVEGGGPAGVVLHNPGTLELRMGRRSSPTPLRSGDDSASAATRQRVLDEWYRERLRELVPPLLARWESTLGVRSAEWRIRKMKTRWGSCSLKARRIWLNLKLAKKPEACLEFIVVHELLHLIERGHGARFRALLDRYLPDWRERRRMLRESR